MLVCWLVVVHCTLFASMFGGTMDVEPSPEKALATFNGSMMLRSCKVGNRKTPTSESQQNTTPLETITNDTIQPKARGKVKKSKTSAEENKENVQQPKPSKTTEKLMILTKKRKVVSDKKEKPSKKALSPTYGIQSAKKAVGMLISKRTPPCKTLGLLMNSSSTSAVTTVVKEAPVAKKFSMEGLPELVLDKICEFLNVKDIGACCSTGTILRNVFNQDHVWRRFCDQLLASHLKVTECKVKPGFVSPEPEDSSLSPICDWRLSYMREVHLWNNWRRNRFTVEYFGSIHATGSVSFMEFVNNNLVIMKLENDRKIMLWDVTGTPVLLGCPATLMTHEYIHLCEILDDGKIIFLQLDIIQIFSMDSPTSDTWTNLGVYHLSPLREEVCESFVADNKVIVVRGDGFVEVFDLKSCKTLVMSDLPKNTDDILFVSYVIRSGKLSKHFAVILGEYQPPAMPPIGITVFMYNIEELRFLQFKICIPLHEYDTGSYHFEIFDNFLAVLDANSLTIYNYLTLEVIYRTSKSIHINVKNFIYAGAYPLFAYRSSNIYRPNKEDIYKKTPTLFFKYLCDNEVAVFCQVLNRKEKNLNEVIQAKVKDIDLQSENIDIMHLIRNHDIIMNKVHTKVLALERPEVVFYW